MSVNERLERKGSGLQVIGVGLPRTGTHSLKLALEQLGFGPCHHTEVVAQEKWPYSQSRQWRKACTCEDRTTRQKLLLDLYQAGNFTSACDHPTAMFADDLVDMYPDAKFILTLRTSPEAWRASVNSTIALIRSDKLYYICLLLPFISLNLHPILRAGQDRERRLHSDVDTFSPADGVEIYDRHNTWVRKTVPPAQLLEFNAAEGWEPLCQFLGVGVPRNEKGIAVPYPRSNDSKQYIFLYSILIAMGIASWLFLFVVLGLLGRYLGIL